MSSYNMQRDPTQLRYGPAPVAPQSYVNNHVAYLGQQPKPQHHPGVYIVLEFSESC